MAFVKLLPPEGGDALPVADLIRRLEDEFSVVDADPEAGQDHVGLIGTWRCRGRFRDDGVAAR